MTVRFGIPALVSIYIITSAQAAFGCTDDGLTLNNQRISVQLCDLGRVRGADNTQSLRVSEQLRSGAKSLDHQTVATVPDGPISPQAIDVIDLAPLGFSQHLHITVRLTPKGPHLDHAIAVPGPLILR